MSSAEDEERSEETYVSIPLLRQTKLEREMASSILWPSVSGDKILEDHRWLLPLKSPPRRMGL